MASSIVTIGILGTKVEGKDWKFDPVGSDDTPKNMDHLLIFRKGLLERIGMMEGLPNGTRFVCTTNILGPICVIVIHKKVGGKLVEMKPKEAFSTSKEYFKAMEEMANQH
jgi:hypothetical protein